MRVVIMLLALLALPAVAHGGARLDVKEMLKDPGVRVVVVEFWADWCIPCKAAIPKWRVLHEKYRSRGLRLVVVAVGWEGTCSFPGWKPDLTVCDEDGSLTARWGVSNLPHAFAWTWQGRLLVEQGHVDEAVAAVDRYFRELPRIAVEEPEVEGGAALAALVRAELRRAAKFEVVASEAEREIIADYRKQGAGISSDENTHCELGKEVSPNSVLRITKEPGKRISLELFSLETACLVAHGRGRLSGTQAQAEETAVFEAVSQLAKALTNFQEPKVEAEEGEVAPTKAPVLVVEGKPRGALVQVTGPEGYKAEKGLPARFENLGAGGYNVRVSMAGYQVMERGLQLKTGRLERLKVELLRRGAVQEYILTVRTEPSFSMVSVDGNPPKTADPTTAFTVTAGKHTVTVMAEDYLNWSREVEVAQNINLTATLVSNLGALEVLSDPPGAAVLVNDVEKGKTPLTLARLDAGNYAVKLRKKGYREVSLEAIAVQRGKTTKVDETLPAIMGLVRFKASNSKGDPLAADVFVNGEKIGQTPMEQAFMVGTVNVVIEAGHTQWTGTAVVSETDVAQVHPTMAQRDVLYRVTALGGSGVLLWSDGPTRTHFAGELSFGFKWKQWVFELGARGYLEEPYDVYLLPGALYFAFDWLYARAGVPVRVAGGFDYGLTLGPGLRLGGKSLAFIAEATGMLLSGSGLAAVAVEGKAGIELTF